ncbi:MAG: hypothetical protein RI966_635, partial [Actinomycetota bacterium]
LLARLFDLYLLLYSFFLPFYFA